MQTNTKLEDIDFDRVNSLKFVPYKRIPAGVIKAYQEALELGKAKFEYWIDGNRFACRINEYQGLDYILNPDD